MWQGIFGHDQVVERFRRTLTRNRLASTYLFVGPPGVGKLKLARELARALLCGETAEAGLRACGACESCRLFAAGNHPDLHQVGLPPDKSTLPISLFLGEKEKRDRQGLCHDIALRPFLGKRKIAIINDADHFSQESANCLLKTLEEPPARSVVILIGTSPSRQLPTIRSRSQVVRFAPLSLDDVGTILLETGAAATQDQAATMAERSDGSVSRALSLADPELWEFRSQLYRDLARDRPDCVRMGRAIQAFVDDAGTEAAAKRDRLKTILGFAIDFYRESGFRTPDSNAGQPAPAGNRRREAANVTSIDGINGDYWSDRQELAVRAVDRTLDAVEAVDRNANLALVIQAWCEAVSELASAASRT